MPEVEFQLAWSRMDIHQKYLFGIALHYLPLEVQMKTATLPVCLAMLLMAISSAEAQERNALSTSRFVELLFKDGAGNTTKTCSGKKAAFSQSYVSIGLEKLTVNKDSSFIQRFMDSNRHVFSAVNLKGNYKSQPLSISKVGKPVSLVSARSSVDLGTQWALLDRVPWVVRDASLEIRVGYGADSSVKNFVDAFNGITSAIPGYSISTSLATGFAITNAIDRLLFAPDRAIDVLRASRDLPLLADQLCEGYYATFSAENNSTYERYYQGSVIWTGNDLEYNGAPINDTTYSVFSVKISDRFYQSAKDALNDSSRGWTSKYRDVSSSLMDLTWIGAPDEISEKEKLIRANLLEARTLLGADLDLIQQEKEEIHRYVQDAAKRAIDDLKKRFASGTQVTPQSTVVAIEAALARDSELVSNTATATAQRIVSNPVANLPPLSPNAGKQLDSSMRNIERLIRFQ